MFSYKTLDKTSIEILHKAFVNAFSDYQVKIDLLFGSLNKCFKEGVILRKCL